MALDELIKSLKNQDNNADASLISLKLLIATGQVNPSQAKEILQAACALSVTRRDRVTLQRNLTQLKPYGATSELLALELLLFLVESRLADFFSLLETFYKEM